MKNLALLICLLFQIVNLFAQPPQQSPSSISPTKGLTKDYIYRLRSDKRPFRIFLDPEFDFAPYGYYLPAWKQVFPKVKERWNSSTQLRFHVQENQVRYNKESKVTQAWVVIEDLTDSKPHLYIYQQWLVMYDHLQGKLYGLRWAGYDGNGEFIKVEDYSKSPRNIDVQLAPGWVDVLLFLQGAPRKEEELGYSPGPDF